MKKIISKLLGNAVSRITIYKSIVGAQEKREVIRRFMLNEPRNLNKDITVIIGLALEDEDWEVRISAMLACVYFSLNEEYGTLVKSIELPSSSASGLNERELKMLAEMKEAAIKLLEKASIPDEPKNLDSEENRELYVRRLVGFKPIGLHSDIRLLFFSLIAPYFYDEPKGRFNPAIKKKGSKYFLGNVELIRLPNIKAFLGGEARNMNKMIFAHIPQNMFVSKDIIQVSELQHLEGYEIDDNTKVNYTLADNYCKKLSDEHNIIVQMPDHYLWEYTVRGFNGRKYPWGNSVEKGQPNVSHPFGIVNYMGHGGEWTKTLVNSKYRIMMGADPSFRAGVIQYSTESYKANLRIAVFGDI